VTTITPFSTFSSNSLLAVKINEMFFLVYFYGFVHLVWVIFVGKPEICDEPDIFFSNKITLNINNNHNQPMTLPSNAKIFTFFIDGGIWILEQYKWLNCLLFCLEMDHQLYRTSSL
jgi:hypothetical protein